MQQKTAFIVQGHTKRKNMEKELQNKLADREINKSAVLAAGCGAIPAPYIDVAGTIVVQMNMVKGLCEIYDVKWDEHIIKGLIGSVLGNIGKRTVASMMKSIPIIGTAVGGFANATLSYVSTIAIGKAFVKYMEVNKAVKSVKDIDLGLFTDFYKSFSNQASSFTDAIRDRFRGKSDASQEAPSNGPEPIAKYGERVFGNKDKFSAWLNKPNTTIAGKKPIDLFLSTNEQDQDKVRRLIQLYAESKTAAKA